ncbi:protein-tyrosine phosphatase-like protein [Flagelloscypha sp. PMI_526]|nr:protein-tyrosine phosphatase-like protein [Flagelloscypha sp. PMI_526]
MVWKNVDAIIEGRLYVGNLISARSTRSLAENRITHILSVCNDQIPAEDVDYADLLIHLPLACQFIHNSLRAGGVVLIHSNQGLSRAPAIAGAYIMWTRRLNATQALEAIRQCNIWPNAGFQEQLVLFELCQYNPSPSNGIYSAWRGKLERRLRTEGLM